MGLATELRSALDDRQCIIYDSDRPDARLIGIEYVVSEDVRAGLKPTLGQRIVAFCADLQGSATATGLSRLTAGGEEVLALAYVLFHE